ncbi:MAG TPA: family 1 encapsulin nanocompartment shell protein [Candidatus Binatia bacterium]|nr:family 1 encapsulin nanocompartment shell protein [Candidatus Binatia bacterium]
MDDLRRPLAPIADDAWQAIDAMASSVLRLNLAARKLVDLDGPKGWKESSVDLGRIQSIGAPPGEGVTAVVRRVQPLVELRAEFELSRAELDDVGRGALDPDLDPVERAAQHIARAEDRAVFHGYRDGGIAGIAEVSPLEPLQIPENYEAYPGVVAEAANRLRLAGIDGPYGIALGPRCYTGLVQATARGGYPVLEIVRQVVGGPVVWAPGVNGAIVLSTADGHFQLTVGRDFSIGYLDHTATTVRLYLVESMTFRVLTPDAAVWLRYGG